MLNKFTGKYCITSQPFKFATPFRMDRKNNCLEKENKFLNNHFLI